VCRSPIIQVFLVTSDNNTFYLICYNPNSERRMRVFENEVTKKISGFESHEVRYILSVTQQSVVGQGLPIVEAARSHSDPLKSVGLLWTSDQPDAEAST
jgi:hypothetical protein